MLISVIIPTMNDAVYLPAALEGLADQESDFELIVADGGSTDGTLDLVDAQAKVVSAPDVSRGEQLDAGAAAASGQVLLFLWPDCRLPATALVAMERNFELLPQTVGGNFHLKFDKNSWFTRLALPMLKRWRYHGRYYGHSGIFVRADVYKDLGGFRSYDLLEDYDLARRMEKQGPTIYLPDTITASAHRFQGRKLRAMLVWPLIHTLYALGVHPDRLGPLWPPRI